MSTSPPSQYADRATAWKELDSYIFGGRYGRRTVPPNLNPAHVEEFIRKRVDRTKSATAFGRTRRVVDFYDLASVLDHFVKMLDKKEGNEKEFTQSLESVKILSEVGGQAYDRMANEYFEYLVRHKLAPENFPSLTEAVEALSPDVNDKLLAERMEGALQALRPKAAADREADDESQRIEELLIDTLPRIEEEQQLRRRILGLPTPAERIEQFCRIYLGWGERDTVELNWWAARWLRREARNNHLDLIATMLRKVESEVQASDLPKEEKEPYATREARAIMFFGVEPNAHERRTLQRAKTSQMDILNREP